MDDLNKYEFIGNLIDNIYNNYKNHGVFYESKNRSLLRAFNHEKDLPVHLFELVYGDDYQERMI